MIVNLNLFVSPIGDILIPVVGTVGVDGLTINNGFKLIKSKCLEKYNDSNISITLSKVREFKIKVLGPFEESGIYVSTPINRVSNIYNQIMTKNTESTLIDKSIVNIKDSLTDMILPLMNLDKNVFPENILIPQENIKKLKGELKKTFETETKPPKPLDVR